MAVRSGDPFAVQRLLGHANLLMVTRYVQDVSKQTDKVIEERGKSKSFVCFMKNELKNTKIEYKSCKNLMVQILIDYLYFAEIND